MILVLKTDLCKIVNEQNQYKVFVKIEKGGWLQLQPFTNDPRGLVGALTVATEVCAGKFWPLKVVETPVIDGYIKSIAGGKQDVE